MSHKFSDLNNLLIIYFLFFFRQQVIETAISEKDSQIAFIEVSGAKSQIQIERLDKLRSERNTLNGRLKIEVSLGV